MKLERPIAAGNTAEIYRQDKMIFKVFKDNLPDGEAIYEAEKQKYAYSCGLPVPRVIDVTNMDGKQVIIMEYVRGRTIGELLLEDFAQAEYFLRISVDIQRKIHAVNVDGMEPMSEKLRRQIGAAAYLDDRKKGVLIEKLAAMNVENRLCHGDFHLHNLIMSQHDITIIDWVDASIGDIRADVYRTYLLYTQHATELADMYVRLYCEKSGLTKDEIFDWAPIIAGARLEENVGIEEQERLLRIVNAFFS